MYHHRERQEGWAQGSEAAIFASEHFPGTLRSSLQENIEKGVLSWTNDRINWFRPPQAFEYCRKGMVGICWQEGMLLWFLPPAKFEVVLLYMPGLPF